MDTERFFFYAIKAWSICMLIFMTLLLPVAVIGMALRFLFHHKGM